MEHGCLIVGLGNPGTEYAETRHNAGFQLVERLAERWRARWQLERAFKARLAKTAWSGWRVFLCQPMTYMNSSGEAVGAAVAYYGIELTRLLVTLDDADLPLGELRLRPGGGTGGHHGLESIERHLATRDYPRLRLGIGRSGPGEREITDRVLSRFAAPERELWQNVLCRAADQVECWVAEGIELAMTRFNGAIITTKETQ